MADLVWPEDIFPYVSGFYLQPHTGGSESPFSQATKVYGLSAPRWICSMRIRAPESADNWAGTQSEWGERMDALLAQLRGRENRIRIHDFRRPGGIVSFINDDIAAGDTAVTLLGASLGDIRIGEYIGGDGRPHIITSLSVSGSNLIATVEPPFSSAVAADTALFEDVDAPFRLSSDDQSNNTSTVGELTEYALEFVEDVSPYPDDLDVDVLAYARTASLGSEGAERLSDMVKTIKANFDWSKVLIVPTTSDWVPAMGATIPTLGGWTSDAATVNGAPVMKQAGLDFASNNVDQYLTVDLPGLNTLNQLLVIQAQAPLHSAGQGGSARKEPWDFGNETGTRHLGLAAQSGSFSGEGLVLGAANGAARDRGHSIANYPYSTDELFIAAQKFNTNGLKSWKNGVIKTIDLGGSTAGDFSPNSIGSLQTAMWIGGGNDNGALSNPYIGKVACSIFIKESSTISDASVTAVSNAVAAAIVTPTPRWKVAPGVETHTGAYCPSDGKLYHFGGDTNVVRSNLIRSIDRTTGLVTVKNAVMPTDMQFRMAVVWHSGLSKFVFYGGTGASGSGATTTVYTYDPAADVMAALSETLPVALSLIAVARDPTGANKTYLFGGGINGDGHNPSNAIYVHDHTAHTITALAATITIGVTGAFAFAHPGSNYIYFGGGAAKIGSLFFSQKKLYRLNVSTGAVEACPDIPYVVDTPGFVWHAPTGKGYVIAGYDGATDGTGNGGTYYSSIISITPNATAGSVTSTTTADTVPQAQDDFAADVDGDGNIWLIGIHPPITTASFNNHDAQMFFAKYVPGSNAEMMVWN